MTDRIKGFIVVLENDLLEDDAAETMIALQNIRGVCPVKASVSNPNDLMNREKVRLELIEKIYKALE